VKLAAEHYQLEVDHLRWAILDMQKHQKLFYCHVKRPDLRFAEFEENKDLSQPQPQGIKLMGSKESLQKRRERDFKKRQELRLQKQKEI
jgi:hypothetical protein